MTTKIQKWGNSLAIRIPKEFAKGANLQEGSVVSFSADGQSLIIKPRKKPVYTLEELMKDFNPKTKHKLIDWGPDVGKEILDPWEGDIK